MQYNAPGNARRRVVARLIWRPPSAPAFSIYENPETVTLGVDNPADGSASVTLSTRYPTSTLVEVTFNGMITRELNSTHATTQFGPAGLAAPGCPGLVQITWDSGGSWYPSTGCTTQSQAQASWTSNRFGVKGTARVFRYPGTTSCGDPAPCFTYTGSQSITVTPVQGNLVVTATPNEMTSSTWVAFNAMNTNGIPRAHWAVTEWRWMPEGGSPAVVCTWNDTTCAWPITQSGTMQVTGVVNGVTRVATVYVKFRCVTGDSALDNSAALRSAIGQAWDSTRVANPPGGRLEVPMAVYTSPDSYGPPTPGTLMATPCSWNGSFPLTNLFALVHTHPLLPTDSVPQSACPDDEAGPSGYLRGELRPTAVDALIASRHGIRSYVVTRDSIYRFNGVGAQVDTVVELGGTYYRPHAGWENLVTPYSRTGPNACHVP